jgi:DNA-binding transcriptional LysR family regulator
MRFEQLIQFLAVTRTGNFRKASRELGISQPALTRSIQSLEHYFNVPLFDRLSTGVTLTDYGKTAVEWAKEAVANTENVKRQIDLLNSMSTGQLVVGTGAYFADSILAESVARLISKKPGLRIKILRDTLKNAEKLILNRKIDLFLGWTEESNPSKEIMFKTLIKEPIVLFCRNGHPLVGMDKPDMKEVLKYPFAGPMVPNEVREMIDLFRQKYTGLDDPLLTVEFDSYSEVRKVVELSDCVGGLPESSMQPYFDKGIFVRLSASFPGLKGRAGISFLKYRTLLPAAELLIEELTWIVKNRSGELNNDIEGRAPV